MEPASQNPVIVVCGAGVFIGGHLVASLARDGFTNIRAFDSKPLNKWYQLPDNIKWAHPWSDLGDRETCFNALNGAHIVFNLAADMGGMGFIENNKALCMLSVLINTNLLIAARELGVARYFFASSACVYAADK